MRQVFIAVLGQRAFGSRQTIICTQATGFPTDFRHVFYSSRFPLSSMFVIALPRFPLVFVLGSLSMYSSNCP